MNLKGQYLKNQAASTHLGGNLVDMVRFTFI
ncbi:MAG: hypothetical protein Ct9H300mP18_08100 [Candidatus Neomarinimicrobiota bacterium]|nr:MAG: hypothetical protein Ct9H300mP18_08100 [Candidatus Neomarinimicrobiota bacterium]